MVILNLHDKIICDVDSKKMTASAAVCLAVAALAMWRATATSQHEMHAFHTTYAKRYDENCVLRLLPGFERDPARWSLELPMLGVGPIEGSFKLVDEALAGSERGALCAVVLENSRQRPSSPQNLLLALATEMGYLNSTKQVLFERHTLTLWSAFVSKATYVEKRSLALVLWLGRFGDEVDIHLGCMDSSPSLHSYKALAASLALETFPTVKAIAYVDADAVVANESLIPADFLEAAGPDVDLVGTSDSYSAGGKPFVVLNGGVWVLRNSRWAKEFLYLWWTYRCGNWDQLALWRTLFELWRAVVPAFKFDANRLFHTWPGCKARALRVLVSQVRVFGPSAWRGGRRHHSRRLSANPSNRTSNRTMPRYTNAWLGPAAVVFEATACLLAPLRLPHVMLLPTVPFLDHRNRPSLPLQHYHAHMQFVCHLDQRRLTDEATDFYCTKEAAERAAANHSDQDDALCSPAAMESCFTPSVAPRKASFDEGVRLHAAVRTGRRLWWLATCNRTAVIDRRTEAFDISNKGRWCGKCNDIPRKILRSLCAAPSSIKTSRFFADLRGLVLHPACHAHVHRIVDDGVVQKRRRRRRSRHAAHFSTAKDPSRPGGINASSSLFHSIASSCTHCTTPIAAVNETPS